MRSGQRFQRVAEKGPLVAAKAREGRKGTHDARVSNAEIQTEPNSSAQEPSKSLKPNTYSHFLIFFDETVASGSTVW